MAKLTLEKINLNDPQDEASRKIYENDERLKEAIENAQQSSTDLQKEFEDFKRFIEDAKTDKQNILNVSQLNDNYAYTSKQSARNAVPVKLRALGQIIVYKRDIDKWEAEQFTSGTLDNWGINEFWKSFGNGTRVFDGGRADTLYGGARVIDCGTANSVFDGDLVDCEKANR